jgi:tRNA(Ile2)-agmatinylcytidine synthase
LEDKDTNSGLVILEEKPDYEVYLKAVKKVVSLDETKKLLKEKNAFFKGYKNMRGLIGATASTSWNSGHDSTFELIAYREKNKWGSKRFVDDKSTIKMDSSFPSTFDNFDYENKHNRIVPKSPCPVLFGIRGENFQDLFKAKSMIKSEKVDCWIIFESNQATDDHLQRKKISAVSVYDSVALEGVVNKKPLTFQGGHVIFSIADDTGIIDCAAYEPTKKFRNLIRALTKGDAVEVFGGVKSNPLTVNLEKIKIIDLVEKNEKVENPVCSICGKHMKSIGSNQGYRCKKCGTKSDMANIVKKKRMLESKFYEVPICARRHLSKPIKRMK